MNTNERGTSDLNYANACLTISSHILHGNIDQALLNALHGLLKHFKIGLLDCLVITSRITRVHRAHMFHPFV